MRHKHKSILRELNVSLAQHHSKWKPSVCFGATVGSSSSVEPGQSPRPICLLRVFHERLCYQWKEDFLAGLASELCFLKSLYPWITSGSIVGDALHPLQQCKWDLRYFAWSLWGYNYTLWCAYTSKIISDAPLPLGCIYNLVSNSSSIAFQQ